MHGSGWVGLMSFFNPIYHGGLKKNPTQPNPSQGSNSTCVDRVRLDWTIFFKITIIIIIKLNIRTIPLQIRVNL